MRLPASILFYTFFAAFMCACKDINYDNALDLEGDNYMQKVDDLILNPDSPEKFTTGDLIKSAVENHLSLEIFDDGTGRPISYTLSTKDTNRLAIKVDEKTLFGHPRALNIAVLKIIQTSGWQETSRSAENDTFKVSWWRDPDTLVIADFERIGSRLDNCGGEFGAWNRFPNDPTQHCNITDAPGQGINGSNCIRVEYDVKSPNLALCGAFFKLDPDKDNGTKDLAKYKYVNLWIRGDNQVGFDEWLQIEFKRPESVNEAERFTFNDITSGWVQKEAELDEFERWTVSGYDSISDWSKINEFTLTFADTDLVAREGAIFIDNIILVDSKPYSGSSIK